VDNLSPQDRSKNMAAIRSSNTSPEMRLRKAVWRAGERFFTSPGWFRITGRRLAGSPDLVFPSARVVVFVDGCFWHGCPVHYQAPTTRPDYWRNKVEMNRLRDQKVTQQLHEDGWTVVRIWEHALKARTLDATVDELLHTIRRAREEILQRAT